MGAIKDTLFFEIEEAISSFKKYDTWIFICVLFSLIMVLYKELIWAIVLLIIVLILNGAKSYATGQVAEYRRKKYKQQLIDNNECQI